MFVCRRRTAGSCVSSSEISRLRISSRRVSPNSNKPCGVARSLPQPQFSSTSATAFASCKGELPTAAGDGPASLAEGAVGARARASCCGCAARVSWLQQRLRSRALLDGHGAALAVEGPESARGRRFSPRVFGKGSDARAAPSPNGVAGSRRRGSCAASLRSAQGLLLHPRPRPTPAPYFCDSLQKLARGKAGEDPAGCAAAAALGRMSFSRGKARDGAALCLRCSKTWFPL